MKIIFCYVAPHPKALAAVNAYAPQAEHVDTSVSKWAYWHEISSRWTGEDDLMTVEQDIEITAEVIPSFENCPEPWCLYEYQAAGVFGGREGTRYRTYPATPIAVTGHGHSLLQHSLGCTRFRKELQQLVPAHVIAGENLKQWPGHVIPSDPARILWDRIDYRIESHLTERGITPHIHGEVKHYHAYPKESVNARVQRAVEQYLATCRHPFPETQARALEIVQGELALARSGELHANPLLLSQ